MSSITKSSILHEDCVVKVYNPEEKKLIGVFKSYAKAAGRLGVTSSTIFHKVQSKRRLFSPNLNMEVAVRYGQIKPGDEELIEKTAKFQPL